MSPEETVRQLATLLDTLDPAWPQPPKTGAQIAAEDRLEAIAEDRAWERRHGRVDEGVIQRREDAYEAWLGGDAA